MEYVKIKRKDRKEKIWKHSLPSTDWYNICALVTKMQDAPLNTQAE